MEGYQVVRGQLRRVQPEEAFPFLKEAGHVVSLVGGGGKTTLLYFLAEAYRRRGLRAVVLTTTHIYDPALPVGRPGIVDFGGEHVSGIAQIQACWARGGYPVLGVRTTQKAERQSVFTEEEPGRKKRELLVESEQEEGQQKPLAEIWQEKGTGLFGVSEQEEGQQKPLAEKRQEKRSGLSGASGQKEKRSKLLEVSEKKGRKPEQFTRTGRSWEKLGPPAEEELAFVLAHADAVLVEADGARRMPCKLPAAHEPVILPESDWVVGVAGLSALGKPVREVCFRVEENFQKSYAAEPSRENVLKCCMAEQSRENALKCCAAEQSRENALKCCAAERSREDIQECFVAEQSQDVILEHCMSEQDLAWLLASQRGARKGVGERKYLAVLNQCDGAAVMQQGDQILRLLAGYGIDAVMTGFAERERAGV